MKKGLCHTTQREPIRSTCANDDKACRLGAGVSIDRPSLVARAFKQCRLVRRHAVLPDQTAETLLRRAAQLAVQTPEPGGKADTGRRASIGKYMQQPELGIAERGHVLAKTNDLRGNMIFEMGIDPGNIDRRQNSPWQMQRGLRHEHQWIRAPSRK